MDDMSTLVLVGIVILVVVLLAMGMKRDKEGMMFSSITPQLGYRRSLRNIAQNPYSGIEMENAVAQ